MNPEAIKALEGICKKEVHELTEYDKGFLRARVSYLTPEQLKKYQTVFETHEDNTLIPTESTGLVKHIEISKAIDLVSEISKKYFDLKVATKNNTQSALELMTPEDRKIYDEAQRVINTNLELLQNKNKPSTEPKKPVKNEGLKEFHELQKQAKALGVDTKGLNKEQLKDAILSKS